jgi:hypothetical protein
MVSEGAPTTSLFAQAKDVDADRSLCPGPDPGIGMTGSAAVESDTTTAAIRTDKAEIAEACPGHTGCPLTSLRCNIDNTTKFGLCSVIDKHRTRLRKSNNMVNQQTL